ncbi:MFS gliotoxin efflux transporter glia [Karstenula rhodostoma CBS 690.94]|uniref:MFS gliotoxin efflux transporter glia n=1 Tax=Karstenula rhodostoma CBS 690.94 TaxID=1392251 RepID=A0A9P4UGC9_9PLEO|nr:MFS gliotoxin efflux transporter glia [Karstenula rhodostoma CBS 690.94]
MDEIELASRTAVPAAPAPAHPNDAKDDPHDAASLVTITTSSPQYQHPKGIRLVLLTLGLMLSILLAALDSSIIATAIPTITTEFGSIANIAWYGSAYSVTNGAFKLVWGKAYQYFPLKRVFMLSVAIFEVGNIICGASQSSEVLILGRVVAGVGGGGVMTGSFIIIAISVRDEYRAAYMGVVSATFGISSVAGPLLGGGLTDSVGWRWCFWISLPIGGLAVIIMTLTFRSPIVIRDTKLRDCIIGLDLGGGVLVTSFLSCFVLGMHYSGSQPWKSPKVWGSLVGSALSFLAFIYNEYKMRDKAMIHAHLIKKLDVCMNLMYGFFLAGLFFPLQYMLPVQFQSVDATSASGSGIRLIPLILAVSVFTAFSNGALTWWRHHQPFLLLGAFLATAGAAAIYSVDAPATTRKWLGFELLTGMGIGLCLQIPMIYNQSLVSRNDIPSVTSLTLFTENLGTSLFVASCEASFQQGLVAHLKKSLPSLDPHDVVNAGATQIRNLFHGDELDMVLGSYLHGCRVSHLIALSCGVVACMVSVSAAGPSVVRKVMEKLGKSHSV